MITTANVHYILSVILGLVLLCACTPSEGEQRRYVDRPLRYEDTVHIKGITVADDFPDYTSKEAQQLYDSAAAAGVEWVAITPCGFLNNIDDTVVAWTRWSRRDYVAGIRAARSAGLRVFVKPYIWSMDFWSKKKWTGDIVHNDSIRRAAFFRSYTQWLCDCAAYARDGGAELFCIGLELPKLSGYAAEWRRLIDTLRTVYNGPITYACHGIDEAETLPFADQLSVIGVNIYPSLSRADHPTDADLDSGWANVTRRLQKLSSRNNRRIVLTEAGFRSMERTTWASWEWPEHSSRRTDTSAQRQAYEALARACYGQPWFAGIFWWKVYTDPRKQNEGPDGFSPQGKPAWSAMTRGFREWTTRTP